MSSTNKTTNYNLSQFVGTDVPSYLGDYNGDMSKIDKAIGDVANSQGSVEQSVVGLTADVQGLSTQVSGVSTSVQQLQTSVAQIDSGYKQADTALSQRITTNANNIQTNTTAIEGINTTIGTEDISGIGDGTIKGAVSNLNNSLSRFINTTPILNLTKDVTGSGTYDYTVTENGLYSISNYIDPKGATSHESNAAIIINNKTFQKNKCAGAYATSSVSIVIPLKTGDIIKFSYGVSDNVTDDQNILLYKLF